MCGKISKDQKSRYDSLVWCPGYGDFPYRRTFSELMLSSAIASHRVFELITILSIADDHENHET